MNHQISLQQYRTIDLAIMLVIEAACQLLTSLAIRFWYPEQLYVASPVAGIVALVMMRWGGFAAIHAAFGGVLYAMLAGGSWQQIVIYGAGNLLSLGAMLMLRLFGKEAIRRDGFLSVVFAFLVQTLMWLGRGGVAALLGGEIAVCFGFITTDVLSGLLTCLIIWIIRPIDGLFEDQKHYLLRTEAERQAERREQF